MNARQRLESAGPAPTDEQWSAIESRRPIPGATWLLVVTSTGIACRPGCPARTPGRDRVRIVSGLDEAIAVGARACLRCRPDRPESWTVGKRAATGNAAARGSSGGAAAIAAVGPDPVSAAAARLSAGLESGDEVPTDRELAAGLEVSERRLRELFRERVGVTPRAWVAARRAERLRAHLSNGRDVLGALFDAGYGSSSAAYEAAGAELGMAPGRYRTGGVGERIRWTVASIPDGVALVAATDRGLCAVRLGSAAGELESDLRTEFPRAAVTRDDPGMADLAALVSDMAVGRPRPEASTLPIDVHATAFRRRVWEALRHIPAGETRSYGQVAASIGAPKAARAVGSACAANPVAVVVPCHRVVGFDGSLHGYAYGLARKKQLLDAERAAAGDSAGTDRTETTEDVTAAVG
jgi:AraC family transcriptional regulator, regulatory protein of adaptative response / methylated-DNA-[protein]-cysteine methyltransferase